MPVRRVGERMSIHKVTYHSKEKYLLLGVSLREYLRCPIVFAQGGGD